MGQVSNSDLVPTCPGPDLSKVVPFQSWKHIVSFSFSGRIETSVRGEKMAGNPPSLAQSSVTVSIGALSNALTTAIGQVQGTQSAITGVGGSQPATVLPVTAAGGRASASSQSTR